MRMWNIWDGSCSSVADKMESVVAHHGLLVTIHGVSGSKHRSTEWCALDGEKSAFAGAYDTLSFSFSYSWLTAHGD
jgi:hypothetical protein